MLFRSHIGSEQNSRIGKEIRVDFKFDEYRNMPITLIVKYNKDSFTCYKNKPHFDTITKILDFPYFHHSKIYNKTYRGIIDDTGSFVDMHFEIGRDCCYPSPSLLADTPSYRMYIRGLFPNCTRMGDISLIGHTVTCDGRGQVMIPSEIDQKYCKWTKGIMNFNEDYTEVNFVFQTLDYFNGYLPKQTFRGKLVN